MTQDTLANQKPDEMARNGSTTTTKVQHKGEPYMWSDQEVELLLNIILECKINKMQENAI